MGKQGQESVVFFLHPFGVNRCHASTQISTMVGHNIWLYNSSLRFALRITTSWDTKIKEMRGCIKIPRHRMHGA